MPAKKKISEKTDKRYRAKITIPGSSKPVYISAKTKKELDEKRRATVERLLTGKTAESKPFVDIVVAWWETDKKPRLRSDATIAAYRSAINRHILTAFDHHQLIQAVTIDDLQACVDSVAGMSASISNRVIGVLQGAYGYAIKRRIHDTDLSLYLMPPNTKPPKHRDFLTDEQTARLLKAAAVEEYGILIYLLYYTGMRRGEALALRWCDVDLRKNLIHVCRTVTCNTKVSEGKTKAANRYIPIPVPLQAELKKRRGLPDECVVHHAQSTIAGHMMSAEIARRLWIGMMYRCGLATLSEKYYGHCKASLAKGLKPPRPTQDGDIIAEITPHWLRHNYVSILYDAGVDAITATRIVGHSSYKVTADIYTHISNERQRQAAVNLDAVFAKVAQRLPNGDENAV